MISLFLSINPKRKFCVDCTYCVDLSPENLKEESSYAKMRADGSYHFCRHPSLSSPVTGAAVQWCSILRESFGSCGPSAKFFTGKNP